MNPHRARLRYDIAIAPLLAAAVIAAIAAVIAGGARAQNSTPMAKPPHSASGALSASNPDPMPVKKPRKPTDDDMLRREPASAATAK